MVELLLHSTVYTKVRPDCTEVNGTLVTVDKLKNKLLQRPGVIDVCEEPSFVLGQNGEQLPAVTLYVTHFADQKDLVLGK